ncbi:MAG: hypothetical protein WBV83_15700, partial [Bradyrhizobium sp.]|uniref:hypothetical protein n=1 Tax=Bradyrhizobium sp. TaxID=376 RepID=UPI003C5CC12F
MNVTRRILSFAGSIGKPYLPHAKRTVQIEVPSPLVGEGVCGSDRSLIRVRGISFQFPMLRQTPHPPSMPGIEGTLSH